MTTTKDRLKQGDIVKIDSKYLGLVVNHPYLSNTSPFIWVVPISDSDNNYPTQIKLERTKTTGTIYVEQIHSLDFKDRQIEFIEKIELNTLKSVLETARELLLLEDL